MFFILVNETAGPTPEVLAFPAPYTAEPADLFALAPYDGWEEIAVGNGPTDVWPEGFAEAVVGGVWRTDCYGQSVLLVDEPDADAARALVRDAFSH